MSEVRLLKPCELNMSDQVQIYEDGLRTEKNPGIMSGGILTPNILTVPAWSSSFSLNMSHPSGKISDHTYRWIMFILTEGKFTLYSLRRTILSQRKNVM